MSFDEKELGGRRDEGGRQERLAGAGRTEGQHARTTLESAGQRLL